MNDKNIIQKTFINNNDILDFIVTKEVKSSNINKLVKFKVTIEEKRHIQKLVIYNLFL